MDTPANNAFLIVFSSFFKYSNDAAAGLKCVLVKDGTVSADNQARHKFSHRAMGQGRKAHSKERSRTRREQDKQGQTRLG